LETRDAVIFRRGDIVGDIVGDIRRDERIWLADSIKRIDGG
jgi:hypothetical protein